MRLFRRAFWVLVLVAVVVITAAVFTRAGAVWTILQIFPRWVVALIVALTLLGEMVKIFRWHFFLRAAGMSIRLRDSATSLLAGQTASVLHGGDLLRVRLAVEHGVLPRAGLTVSFAMWATDMMALPLLALAGLGTHLVARWVLFLPLAIPIALLLLIRSRRFARFVSKTLGRFRFTRRFALSEEEIEHVTHLLTRRSVLFGGVAYAVVMRLIFAAILLCITDVISDQKLGLQTILSAHALSTLAGAFSFLPGLIAVGSLVGLLGARGVSHVLGLLISLTNRLVAVAFNLGIGFLVLLTRYRNVVAATSAGEIAAARPLHSLAAPAPAPTIPHTASTASPPPATSGGD